MIKLTNISKTYKVYGTNGTSELLDCTFDTSNKFGGIVYKATSGDVIGLYEIVAFDDTGKDLGITSSSNGISVTTNDVYSVTMNANNGTAATKAYVEAGAKLSKTIPIYAGYAFVGWYIADLETLISTDLVYTTVVKNDLSLVAKFKKVEQAINGHEYVDLGLPSGLKWATCNVGAAYPEDYGGYYAWGEIEEKEYYHWSTYKYCYLDENRNYSMTKYCLESNYGIVDRKIILDPEDDVAHVKWGGTWRMPTEEDFDELCEICTSKWITQNGVKGRIFTGPNGNSIFLPAAGYNVDEVFLDGGIGYYWSNSLIGGRTLGDYSNKACSLDLTRSTLECDANSRDWGYSVRPVTE